MFSDISIEHKHLQCLFELGICLSEERFASLQLSGKCHLWERLIELSENYSLFAYYFVVFRREILAVDALAAKFQQLANQIAKAYVHRSTQFPLPSLRNDF